MTREYLLSTTPSSPLPAGRGTVWLTLSPVSTSQKRQDKLKDVHLDLSCGIAHDVLPRKVWFREKRVGNALGPGSRPDGGNESDMVDRVVRSHFRLLQASILY